MRVETITDNYELIRGHEKRSRTIVNSSNEALLEMWCFVWNRSDHSAIDRMVVKKQRARVIHEEVTDRIRVKDVFWRLSHTHLLHVCPRTTGYRAKLHVGRIDTQATMEVEYQ